MEQWILSNCEVLILTNGTFKAFFDLLLLIWKFAHILTLPDLLSCRLWGLQEAQVTTGETRYPLFSAIRWRSVKHSEKHQVFKKNLVFYFSFHCFPERFLTIPDRESGKSEAIPSTP